MSITRFPPFICTQYVVKKRKVIVRTPQNLVLDLGSKGVKNLLKYFQSYFKCLNGCRVKGKTISYYIKSA